MFGSRLSFYSNWSKQHCFHLLLIITLRTVVIARDDGRLQVHRDTEDLITGRPPRGDGVILSQEPTRLTHHSEKVKKSQQIHTTCVEDDNLSVTYLNSDSTWSQPWKCKVDQYPVFVFTSVIPHFESKRLRNT
mmetsp:Transcript_39130/g.93706  ORF Transcript_39130/g.93706 Transcript_39130/m.93706 type:complete len:133 (+) Transcript_39130:37-435(+)